MNQDEINDREHANPANWSSPFAFYHSSRDSRLWVPKQEAWMGRTLNMANAVEAVDAAWREFGPFDTVIGHSFGGAVVLNSAGGTISGLAARVPRRLVLVSAPNDIPNVLVQFFSGFFFSIDIF